MANLSGAHSPTAAFELTAEHFQGQPCHRLTLPCGDSVLVALQGAHVLSWVSQGREQLFLSDHNVWNGQAAIRGGVPVCFPQFNQRGDLPKHGFARHLPWCLDATDGPHAPHMTFRLVSNEQTHAIWQQHFVATLRVALHPNQLQITLQVDNTDDRPLQFTGALHTYLAVQNIANVQLTGLGGQAEWNAVTDHHATAADALRFDGEFDRVYQAASNPLQLQEGGHTLNIAQSPSWGQSVVWNPGVSKCAALTDMPPDGYQHMLCVEAAQVYQPISVAPATQWEGWQRLSLV